MLSEPTAGTEGRCRDAEKQSILLPVRVSQECQSPKVACRARLGCSLAP